MNLTPSQHELHQRALTLSQKHRRLEWEIIEVLQQIDQNKLFKRLGYSSLFKYVTESLGFSEAVAFSFILVARKSREVTKFGLAIKDQSLTVSKASRIVSVLTTENAGEIISLAKCSSTREIAYRVAELNPKAAKRDSAKPLSADLISLTCNLSKPTFEMLKRVQTLLSQKGAARFDEALNAALTEYLKRHDPVEKAKVASERLCARKVKSSTEDKSKRDFTPPRRKPLKAYQKHTVIHRDGGRCTFTDTTGKRCDNDRWLHLHHLKAVSQGGSNEPENLTTLCSFHHDLVHQLSLPLDGQVSWLRSPQRKYG